MEISDKYSLECQEPYEDWETLAVEHMHAEWSAKPGLTADKPTCTKHDEYIGFDYKQRAV